MVRNKSFTIIELLVVIALIGMISSIALVTLDLPGKKQKARVAKTLEFSQSIQSALGSEAVGIWDFDEGNGTVATDRSGFGNNGAISGASYSTNTPQSVLGQGQGKYALSFSGSASVNNGSKSILEIQEHTIEFWIKYTGTVGNWAQIIAKHAPGTDRAPGIWACPGSTGLHWRYDPGNQGAGCLGPDGESTNFNLNQWYHIAGTKKGTILKIYINGKQVGSDYAVPNPITQGSGNLYFGQTGYLPFYGFLDEVRIYSQALTIGQIQKHYAEGLEKHQNLATK